MSTSSRITEGNPFPGLRPYRPDEDHLFFGRENQVDAMVDKLSATKFLTVVGTSGSGKSSLVNCGLRPALHRGLMADAGTSWRVAQFRPGGHPIAAMARSLAEDGVLFARQVNEGLSMATMIETTLRMSRLGLIDAYEQARVPENVNLLVVVDQFEELFRFRSAAAAGRRSGQSQAAEATEFVNLLLEVAARRNPRVFVVLTMRSDFLGDCAQFPGLAQAITDGQYLVPRLTRDERRDAIVGPVGVGGAEISPVLVTRLVNDVGDSPDQLPILQHALNRTWARWQRDASSSGPIQLEHYDAIGSMKHALDHHAEEVFTALGTDRKRRLCELMFKALTDKATDARGVRRPTTFSSLRELTGATDAELTDIIDAFRQPDRSFLMPPAGEVLEDGTIVDISHESLMRVWTRLGRWADEEASSANEFVRLAELAERHEAEKELLLRNPNLALFTRWWDEAQPNQAWADRYEPGFERASRYLVRSQRVARRRRVMAGAGVVALVVAVGVFALLARWAFDQRNDAVAARDEAEIAVKDAVEAERTAAEARAAADQSAADANDARDAAVAEKLRALRAQFNDFTLNIGTNQNAGSICIDGAGDCVFGRPIAGLDLQPSTVTVLGELSEDDVEFFGFGSPTSRAFVVASESGAGRVVAYAHDGLIRDVENRNCERASPDFDECVLALSPIVSADNLTFTDNALRWARGENDCDAGAVSVAIVEGFESIDNTTEIAELLERRGWEYVGLDTNAPLAPQLECTNVAIWGNPWDMPDQQLSDLVNYVENGGGLLLGGLGWSWYQNTGAPATEYPANRLAAHFGFAFTEDAFSTGATVRVLAATER